MVLLGAWWLRESFFTITYELTQSVCSVISSRMPSSTKDLISSLKHLQGELELSLEYVLQACVQVSSEICMVPLEIVLFLQTNWSSVTESLASSMGVCSQKSCHCVGARLSFRLPSLWASEPAVAACGHVHWVLEVHSMKYSAWEMCVHVLALPACLSLSLVLCFQRVWWS